MPLQPVKDVPFGTILPFEDFPKDFKCPWCDTGKVYRTQQGLRGHAVGKHGIRWGPTPPDQLSESSRQLYMKGIAQDAAGTMKLLPWMMVGIALVEVQGYDYDKASAKLGRPNKKDLIDVAGSPAGLKYVEWLKEQFSDPLHAAKLVLQAQALDATISFLTALEWAKEAHDYDAVHRMTKDLLKATGTMEPEVVAAKNTYNIYIGKGNSLDVPEIEADWEEIVDFGSDPEALTDGR